MRQVRDIVVSLVIGVVWMVVVMQVVGSLAAASSGHPPEIDALARGDALAFVGIALLRDVAIYAIPSLLAAYLITRLMTVQQMKFALVAGASPFLFSAYLMVQAAAAASVAGARGVYFVLNAVLVLLAIPAALALIRYSKRVFPGAAAQTD